MDTHTFLWWIADDARLPHKVREIIRAPENEVYFSAVSAWEISIKAQLGRIGFRTDLVDAIPYQVAVSRFSPLAITMDHALGVFRLPLLHRDPFDRMLVAQSRHHRLPLLTADPLIAQYDVTVIW